MHNDCGLTCDRGNGSASSAGGGAGDGGGSWCGVCVC